MQVGTWRRLEAHLNGVQGVAGSNPVVPTSKIRARRAKKAGDIPYGRSRVNRRGPSGRR